MNELIAKIEQWAEDRNIIKGSKPIDQAMKLFSEFGELADNVGKGRDCRDDIGDVFVVLTIMCKQLNKPIRVTGVEYLTATLQSGNTSPKSIVASLAVFLSSFVSSAEDGESCDVGSILASLINLSHYYSICSFEECVTIAYNDIKDRKGLMHNGVFIKESDPAYVPVVAAIESNCTIDEGALDNIEADKRMATQKRISVNLEDL